jgi:ribosome-binding protein aMBF1 (putative translation factor)
MPLRQLAQILGASWPTVYGWTNPDNRRQPSPQYQWELEQLERQGFLSVDLEEWPPARIIRFREQRGWSQNRLTYELHAARSSVREWEKGNASRCRQCGVD